MSNYTPKKGEIFFILNNVQHWIQASWVQEFDLKVAKEMDSKIQDGEKIYFKMPDAPGVSQEWRPLAEDEALEIQEGMILMTSNFFTSSKPRILKKIK